MATEKTYKEQLTALGVYEAAFDGTIHSLCVLERELSRTMKAWKATAPSKDIAPSVLDPLYSVILRQRRDIAALRDSLGLTPKGLQKLRGKAMAEPAESVQTSITRALDTLAAQCGAFDNYPAGGTPDG